MKKRILAITMSMLLVAAPVLAKSSSSTLAYKGTEATAKLKTDFNWKPLGEDTAVARTSFDTSNNGYRVAVRLERWSSKNNIADYKYDSDSSIAESNYRWTDVYAYMSRHSIDNSANTVEYAVDSFNHRE